MYELIHKPTFSSQLLALPSVEIPRVLEKVNLLQTSPQPDAKNKKRLKGYKQPIYRIRSGTYRVLYTFGDGWVALLGVDHRKDVYDGDVLIAEAPEFDLSALPRGNEDPFALSESGAQVDRLKHSRSAENDLPVRLDDSLLQKLRVPEQFHSRIVKCKTIDDLLAIDLPEVLRERLFDMLATPNYDEVLEQPSFETGTVDDLLRYHEGELIDFLLKLDPEQERFVHWALEGSGPTLVKGGPGTGKSTIALYRVKSLLDSMKKARVEHPSVLFTTYTNALVSSSQQLLNRILGEDIEYVTVRTADSIVREIVASAGQVPGFLSPHESGQALDQAIRESSKSLSTVDRRVLGQLVERLSGDYLYTEIESVIVAREISSLNSYLSAPRVGRKVGLNEKQRTFIWNIQLEFDRILSVRGVTTWSRMRREAHDLVREHLWSRRFDGVVVDESQDLEPAVLRLLVDLCSKPDRLFITADANQSIYGSSFRWTDVHENLRFAGRTGVLRRNHRSTQEIGEATRSYLKQASLETIEGEAITYTTNGIDPVVRWVSTSDAETRLIARFLREASRDARVGLGSCAVLVPGSKVGKDVAGRLVAAGIAAEFMAGRDLDLERNVVKVITQQSSKGLEFPIVVVAGLLETGKSEALTPEAVQETEETLLRAQRTLFVAMTRAMKALMVVLPEGHPSALFSGFDESFRNTGMTIHS